MNFKIGDKVIQKGGYDKGEIQYEILETDYQRDTVNVRVSKTSPIFGKLLGKIYYDELSRHFILWKPARSGHHLTSIFK